MELDTPTEFEKMRTLNKWITNCNLSRTLKNTARDFSDSVLCAEIIKNYLPKIVDLHNYIPSHNTKQKFKNWTTLKSKVFSKVKFNVSEDQLLDVAEGKHGSIEVLLWGLKMAIEKFVKDNASEPPTPQNKVDLNMHECPICLQKLGEILELNKKLCTLACGHVYCQDCIKKIQEDERLEKACPLCLKPFQDLTPLFL